jgi:hypothetical protein
MNEIKVGSKVRSFDFPDRDRKLTGANACYVEGEVEQIVHMDGCDRYKILVTKRVIGGFDDGLRSELRDIPTHVYPPINGTPSWMGPPTSGVELIEET